MTASWASELLCQTSSSLGVPWLLFAFLSIRTGAENHSIPEVFIHGVKLETFLLLFLSRLHQEGTNPRLMGASSINPVQLLQPPLLKVTRRRKQDTRQAEENKQKGSKLLTCQGRWCRRYCNYNPFQQLREAGVFHGLASKPGQVLQL